MKTKEEDTPEENKLAPEQDPDDYVFEPLEQPSLSPLHQGTKRSNMVEMVVEWIHLQSK